MGNSKRTGINYRLISAQCESLSVLCGHVSSSFPALGLAVTASPSSRLKQKRNKNNLHNKETRRNSSTLTARCC